jgi:hypothetical protein
MTRMFHHGTRSHATKAPTRVFGSLLALAVATVLGSPSAHGSSIYGTLSNFDIYNTTTEPCEGAEIELEGIHSSSIGGDFPAHYSSRSILEYNDDLGQFAGTRITYTGYNFAGAPNPGSLMPTVNPPSTNGHELTYSAGGEHFGFWLNGAQPTATRFFWLNDNNGAYERIGSVPETVPGPTWTYVPPAPGEPAVLQAVIKVPEPEEEDAPNFRPDSTWMKVFKTKVDMSPFSDAEMQNLLEQLISGDPNDPNYANLVPQGEDPIEIESEWELLEGGKNPKEKMVEDEVGESDKVVIRRYEFYKYIGPVNEDNEPISAWEDIGNPDDPGLDVFDDDGNLLFAAERGDFISANMVAAVLGARVPEPSTIVLGVAGFGALLLVRRRAGRFHAGR